MQLERAEASPVAKACVVQPQSHSLLNNYQPSVTILNSQQLKTALNQSLPPGAPWGPCSSAACLRGPRMGGYQQGPSPEVAGLWQSVVISKTVRPGLSHTLATGEATAGPHGPAGPPELTVQVTGVFRATQEASLPKQFIHGLRYIFSSFMGGRYTEDACLACAKPQFPGQAPNGGRRRGEEYTSLFCFFF